MSAHSMYKNISYIIKKMFCMVKERLFSICLILMLLCSLFLVGCREKSSVGQNRRFREFTNEMFCNQTASNTISLHYTLKNPNEYGIKKESPSLGSFETDTSSALAALENIQHTLSRFHYRELSVQNRLTYDILIYYLEEAQKDADYVLYEEPLGLVSGIHTQLPVLLSEYRFYNRDDVEIYLELLKTTPEYFQSLIDFEQKKSQEGLFMSDKAAEQVIEQCEAFLNMGESNYLISTFVDRVTQLKDLKEEEKSDYIQKNALMITDYVLPAYTQLSSEIQKLKGTGKNDKGLCCLPRGAEYYEHEVQTATGSSRSVPEMKEMTKKQIIEDLKAMELVLKKLTGQSVKSASDNTDISRGKDENKENNESDKGEEITQRAAILLEKSSPIQQAASLGAANPVTILNRLQEKIKNSFPEVPETTVNIKYVPEALEEHLSPAFYMIPAIDNYKENVIYVNQAHMSNPLTLFTTLAHEGYPGHLYQTIFFASTKPDPLRSIFNFGGYIEGWATYAEMCSYYLTALTKEQSTLLQKNTSVLLGLYTLADIGIHYEGWSRADTVSFFADYGIRDAEAVDEIYDLILGSPGNYVKYYIGYVEFLELKKAWMEEKGNEFSQKDFHRAVLSVGPAPFDLVKKYMGQLE